MRGLKNRWIVRLVPVFLLAMGVATGPAFAGKVFTIGQWELKNENDDPAEFFKLNLQNVRWPSKTDMGDGTIITEKLKGDPLVPRNIMDSIGAGGAVVQWTHTGGKPVAPGKTAKIEIWIRGNVKPRILSSSGFADDAGGNLPKQPKIPTFEIKKIDPLYAISNEFEEDIGISNLTFHVNVSEFGFGPVEDPPNFPPFDSSLPNFLLAPGESVEFDVPGEVDPFHFFIAEGNIWEGSPSNVVGRFMHGFQLVPTPAAAGAAMTAFGLLALRRGRRQSRP